SRFEVMKRNAPARACRPRRKTSLLMDIRRSSKNQVELDIFAVSKSWTARNEVTRPGRSIRLRLKDAGVDLSSDSLGESAAGLPLRILRCLVRARLLRAGSDQISDLRRRLA